MKINFLNMLLGIFKCFCKLIQGFFCTFLLAFPLLLTYVLCPICCSSICLWILDALLSLGVPESITEGNVVSIPHGIHHAMCFFIKVLTLKQQCSPVALLGSSASSSWSQAANRKSQLHQLPATLLLLYNTGDHMKGLLPCSKGFLLLTKVCLWHAVTELETCPGKDIPSTTFHCLPCHNS